jgi:hypothetical protein
VNYGVTDADWTACTDSSKLIYHPDTACISFDSATRPTRARVNIPIRQVKTPFAQIWGASTVPVSAAAQIQLFSPKAKCGLCVIGTTPLSLCVRNIIVSQADIAINGPVSATNANALVTVSTPLPPASDLSSCLCSHHRHHR